LPTQPPTGQRAAFGKLTALRLSRTTVKIRTSHTARVAVVLERALTNNRRSRRWKRHKAFAVSTAANAVVTRRFRRLRNGTYRLTARLGGQRRTYVRKSTFASR